MPWSSSGEGSKCIWRNSAFAGEFGDAFIKNTQLEGGKSSPAIRKLLEVAQPYIDNAIEMPLFEAANTAALNKIVASMKQCADYSDIIERSDMDMAAKVDFFVQEITKLQPGERCTFPGSWTNSNPARNHAIVIIFECTAPDTFAVVTCNTGGGCEYHPDSNADFPKNKKQCALRLGGIAGSIVKDEALWYMILKLQMGAEAENSRAMYYEVIMPHLCGDRNVQSVIEEYASTGGHPETAQRSGTCFYRCILTAIRYLMKSEGFSQAQQKCLFYFFRRGFLQLAEEQMHECVGKDIINSSDVRLITLAIQMTGLAATKLGRRGVMDASMLSHESEYLDSLSVLLARVAPIDDVGGPAAPFELKDCAELLPFNGLRDLITPLNAGDQFAGAESQVAQDPFVSMFAATTAGDISCSLPTVAKQVESCLQCCLKVRDKSAAGGSSIGLHQVCAVIERTFTQDIQLPKAAEGYAPDGILLESQQGLIRNLFGICMQYVSACKSKNSDRGMDAAHAVTMGAILAVADATVRAEAADKPSALHQVISGKADSMLFQVTAAAADQDSGEELKGPNGHALKKEAHDNHWCDLCKAKGIKKMGTAYRSSEEGSDFDVCQSCFDNKGKELPALEGYSVCGQSYAGLSLEAISAGMLLHSKQLCSARSAVSSYFKHFASKKLPPLMADLQHQKNKPGWQFVTTTDETTLKFTKTLLKVCGCENELPPVNLALGYSERAGGAAQLGGRTADSCTEAEKLGRWFSSSWEGRCPEMAQLRDIIFLNKLMLEPSGLMANDRNHSSWPSLWYVSHARPLFSFCRADENTAAIRVTIADSQKLTVGIPHPSSPANPKDYMKSDGAQQLVTVSEEDVMYESELDLFGSTLTPEEAELVVSFLTVPCLTMQLLLNFFASDRAGLLISLKLQQLLESVIFEPREIAEQTQPILHVPVPLAQRAAHLSTPYGLLHHEMTHSAASLIEPLANLCNEVVTLCTGNYDSRFVPILMFMVRIATRMKQFGGELWPKDDGSMKQFLQVDVPRLLRFWLSQAEDAGNTSSGVQFHAHLALVYGSGVEMAPKVVRLFLCSVAYVVSWHSEAPVQLDKTNTDESKSEMDDMMAMMGMGGPTTNSNADPYPGDGVVNAVIGLFESRRNQVLEYASTIEPDQLDSLLSQMVTVSLKGGVPSATDTASNTSTRGWDLVSSRPLNCTQMVETPHPYPSNWKQRDEIHFPGVEYMSLFFDSRTATEVLCDCVTVYTEDRRGHLIPVPGGEKLSGITWPGKDGRPPLVVTSDRVFVEFSSDASNEDWGFKVTAHAPISQKSANELSVKMSIPLKAVQVALQSENNNVEHAEAGLNNGTYSKEEPAANEEENNATRGVYQDPDGALQVNLQTAEVYIRGRQRIPVPSSISTHADFKAVLQAGGKQPDGLYCAVLSKTSNCQTVQVITNEETYNVCAWRPLRSTPNGFVENSLAARTGGKKDGVRTDLLRGLDSSVVAGYPEVTREGILHRGGKYEAYILPSGSAAPGKGEYDNQHVPEWAANRLLQAMEPLLHGGPKDQSARVEEQPEMFVCTDPLPSHLACAWLMHLPEGPGDTDERKGHPGSLFEIEASTGRKTIAVYALFEQGRRAQRRLVYSTDSRWELRDLATSAGERHEPWNTAMRYEAGNMLEGYCKEDGSVTMVPGAGWMYDHDVGSLMISRKLNMAALLNPLDDDEGPEEYYVPDSALEGVVPGCLLEQFTFWQTSALTLRGYDKSSSGTKQLLVLMNVDGTGVVHRFDQDSSSLQEVLLNPLQAADGSSLQLILEMFCRMENASHVLVWSESGAQVHDTWSIQLSSADHAGLFVSPHGLQDAALSKHLEGIPHAVVLENQFHEHFLMVPNFGLNRVKVSACPFTTDLALDRSEEWSSQVHTRFYVYPVHLSGSFLVTESTSSALYMVLLRLLSCQYQKATRGLQACNSDVPFDDEQRYVLDLISRSADKDYFKDMHPDAVACRMRLTLLCQAARTVQPWNADDDLQGYITTAEHVSAGCKLDLSEEKMIFPDEHPRIQYLEKLEQAAAGDTEVVFQLPPAEACKPIGGQLKMLHSITKQILGNEKLGEAISTQFSRNPTKYQRPAPSELVGNNACNVLTKFWRDELNGAPYGTGFGLLYDMMVGRVDVKITPGSPTGDMKVLEEVEEAAPPEAGAAADAVSPRAAQLVQIATDVLSITIKPEHAEYVLVKVKGNMDQAIAFMMEHNDPEKLQKMMDKEKAMGNEGKATTGAKIDEAVEGPRRSPSCCSTLGKLLFHGQFIKATMDATGENSKEASKNVNKHLLSVFPMAVLVAATQAGATTLDLPFQFPSFPYSQNMDVLMRGMVPSKDSQMETFFLKIINVGRKVLADKSWKAYTKEKPLDPNAVYTVSGAGTAKCNGNYKYAGLIDESEVPIYKHEDLDSNLVLYRYKHPQSGGTWWFISTNGQFDKAEGDYYRVKSDSDAPPENAEWTTEQCPDGEKPCPDVYEMSDDIIEEHPGINCDGCQVKPIKGACYRRQAQNDSEDFCQTCFDKLSDDEKATLKRVKGRMTKQVGAALPMDSPTSIIIPAGRASRHFQSPLSFANNAQSCLKLASSEEMAFFASAPLDVLSGGVSAWADRVAAPIDMSPELPFDLSSHPSSASFAGASILSRMTVDTAALSNKLKKRAKGCLKCLTAKQVEVLRHNSSSVSADSAATLCDARTQLLLLQEDLQKQQDKDKESVPAQIISLLQQANEVKPATNTEDKMDRLQYMLRRNSGLESTVWFEYMAGVLISTKSCSDLQRHNPYLTEETCQSLLSQTADILLTCIRLAQVNRCISRTMSLISHIEKLALRKLEESCNQATPQSILKVALKNTSHNFEAAQQQAQALSAQLAGMVSKSGLSQSQCLMVLYHTDFNLEKAESVLQNSALLDQLAQISKRQCFYDGKKLFAADVAVLTDAKPQTSLAMCHILEHSAKSLADEIGTRRAYMHQQEDGTGFTLDPRFLVFEFLSGFVLRSRQVELVQAFVDANKRGDSRVEQMIMGAGKTTVIAPLLALMLASKDSLVMQVVPSALLDQSRSVLRTCFSSVIQKPVITFVFERMSSSSSKSKKKEATEEPKQAAKPKWKTEFEDREYLKYITMLVTKLKRARTTLSIVVATPESIKSCMLKYIDLLQEVEHSSGLVRVPVGRLSEKQTKRAVVNGEMLSLYATTADKLQELISIWGTSQKGIALLDEVDLLLHPLKSELNYPIGDRLPLDMDPLRWRFPMHMLDAMFFSNIGRLACGVGSSPEAAVILQSIQQAIDKGLERNAFQSSPHITLLIPDYYDNYMQSMFGDWAMLWVTEQDEFRDAISAAIDKSQNSVALSRSTSQSKGLERKISMAGTQLSKSSSTAAGLDGKGFTTEQLESAALAYICEGHIGAGRQFDELIRLSKAGNKDQFKEELSRLKAVQGAELEKAELIVEEHLAEHPEATKLLNLARVWVTNFVPHCISKINRVSYGLLQPHDVPGAQLNKKSGVPEGVLDTRWLLAVPFVGKDRPSKASEFAHPEVQIGLSILAYRYEGLRYSDTYRIVKNLKQQLQNEAGPVKERPKRVLFDKWIGLAIDQEQRSHAALKRQATTTMQSVDVLPLDLLTVEDEDQINKAWGAMQRVPEIAMHFLNKDVFPSTTLRQKKKLSASGVDLGSDLLFGTRFGFSGTPSNLLPKELAPCNYEVGSEADMVRVLTSREYVSTEVMQAWTVTALLDNVAQATSPGYHALIDTGALITGMTNEQVARYLLAKGLTHVEACVFLDTSDRKMVVDRTGAPAVPMERSGLSLESRFTFFDQVHTTGTDIKQPLDACAVVTLGKDMNFRDYAQGVWRMRGIGKGQSVHLVVVNQILELIGEAVGDCSGADGDNKLLKDVVAWLVTNSMRLEEMCQLQLWQQCLTSTWRKQAFRELMSSTSLPKSSTGPTLQSRFHKSLTEEEIVATLEQYPDEALDMDSGSSTATAGPSDDLAVRKRAVDKVMREINTLMQQMATNPQMQQDPQMFMGAMIGTLKHLPGFSQDPNHIQAYAQQLIPAFQACITGGGEAVLRKGVEQVQKTIDQIHKQKQQAAQNPAAAAAPLTADPEKVAQIIAIGFSEKHAKFALVRTKNNVQQAADFIMQNLDNLDKMIAESESEGGGAAATFVVDAEKVAQIVSMTGKSTAVAEFVLTKFNNDTNAAMNFVLNTDESTIDKLVAEAKKEAEAKEAALKELQRVAEEGDTINTAQIPDGANSVARAWYGDKNALWTGQGKDVTAKVKELLSSGQPLKATNELFDDPAPGVPKVLVLELKPKVDKDEAPAAEAPAAEEVAPVSEGAEAESAHSDSGVALTRTKSSIERQVKGEFGFLTQKGEIDQTQGGDRLVVLGPNEAAALALRRAQQRDENGTSASKLRHLVLERSFLLSQGMSSEDANRLAYHRAGVVLPEKEEAPVWLSKCITVFKEVVDFDIPDVVPTYKSLVANMACAAAEFKFLLQRDPDSMVQRNDILEQVQLSYANRAGVDTSQDQEMEQEQQQEKEDEIEVEPEAAARNFAERSESTPWLVADLADPLCMVGKSFFALNQFKPGRESTPLPFQPNLLMSKFMAQPDHVDEAPRRLNNCVVLMRWVTADGNAYTVSVSLAEAESLRRALHNGLGEVPFKISLCLTDGLWLTKKPEFVGAIVAEPAAIEGSGSEDAEEPASAESAAPTAPAVAAPTSPPSVVVTDAQAGELASLAQAIHGVQVSTEHAEVVLRREEGDMQKALDYLGAHNQVHELDQLLQAFPKPLDFTSPAAEAEPAAEPAAEPDSESLPERRKLQRTTTYKKRITKAEHKHLVTEGIDANKAAITAIMRVQGKDPTSSEEEIQQFKTRHLEAEIEYLIQVKGKSPEEAKEVARLCAGLPMNLPQEEHGNATTPVTPEAQEGAPAEELEFSLTEIRQRSAVQRQIEKEHQHLVEVEKMDATEAGLLAVVRTGMGKPDYGFPHPFQRNHSSVKRHIHHEFAYLVGEEGMNTERAAQLAMLRASYLPKGTKFPYPKPTPASSAAASLEEFESAVQSARFWNNELWFDDAEAIAVLRVLKHCPESRRRVYYEETMNCRRRDRRDWDGTGVAKVFSYSNELQLIELRQLCVSIYSSLSAQLQLTQLKAIFSAIDTNSDGVISQDDLHSATAQAGLELSSNQVSMLWRNADANGDGFLDFPEFTASFAFASKHKEEVQQGSPLRRIPSVKAPVADLLIGIGKDIMKGTREGSVDTTIAPHLAAVANPASTGDLFLTSGTNMVSRGDGFISTTAAGSLPSVCPRGVLLVDGSWYFEIVVAAEGFGAVGWATPEYSGSSAQGKGLGDDANSWALRSDGSTAHDNTSKAYTSAWQVGDVVACAVTITNGVAAMHYGHNGSDLKLAHEGPIARGLIPFVSFNNSFSVQLNLGDRGFLRLMPADHNSVHHWIRKRIEFLVAKTAYDYKKLGEVVPTTGDSMAKIEKQKDGQYLVYSEGVATHVFPSVKLDGVVLTAGKWYYECTIVQTEHMATQLGWADLEFIGSNREGVGVGDDKWSWAYDGDRTCLWSGNFRATGNGYINWGKQWESGDVVGVLVDFNKRTMHFTLDGTFYDLSQMPAFQNISFTGGVMPALTSNPGFTGKLNFGSAEFKHAIPEGAQAVQIAIEERIRVVSSHTGGSNLEWSPVAPARSLTRITSRSSFGAEARSKAWLTTTSGDRYMNIEGDMAWAFTPLGNEQLPSLKVANVVLPAGRWVYEVRIVQQSAGSDSYGVFGWGTTRFFGDCARNLGVGDDKESVGLAGSYQDGFTIKHAHRTGSQLNRGHTQTMGEGVNDAACFAEGDIITCAIDTQAGLVRFAKNGVWQAEAQFEGVAQASSGFTPAISLKKGLTVQVNFGQIEGVDGTFKMMGLYEAGYRPVYQAVTGEEAPVPSVAAPSGLARKKTTLVVNGESNSTNSSSDATHLSSEAQMALEACNELSSLLQSKSTTIKDQAKKDAVVKQIAALRAIARGT